MSFENKKYKIVLPPLSLLSQEQEKQMLDDHLDIDDVFCVVDDRQKVVDMWRENGLTCFQVAPGDF